MKFRERTGVAETVEGGKAPATRSVIRPAGLVFGRNKGLQRGRAAGDERRVAGRKRLVRAAVEQLDRQPGRMLAHEAFEQRAQPVGHRQYEAQPRAPPLQQARGLQEGRRDLSHAEMERIFVKMCSGQSRAAMCSLMLATTRAACVSNVAQS